MKFLTTQIFFLIIVSSFAPLAFATHYTSLGMDDVWYWKEYDVGGFTSDPYCLFDSTGDFIDDDSVDNIRFISNDDGVVRPGSCMFLKTFLISDIENPGGSNTFNLRIEQNCDVPACANVYLAVLDGNYQQYYNYSGEGSTIWPDDNTVGSFLEFDALASGSWGDLEAASSGILSSLHCDTSSTTGTDTLTCTIDNTEWGRALTSYITVFWAMGSSAAGETNWWISPEEFSITSTPNGTLTWNWPESSGELTNWDLYSDHLLELNGTKHDYGYFITYDEGIPDPPTNLIAVTGTSSIELDWDAPIFNGYDPITAYKIERESPIGGGFTTIVPNTGSVVTGYTDTSVIIGNEYNYRVRAINSHGESAPSNESKDGIGSSITDPTPDVDCTGLNLDTFTLYDRGVTQNSATLCWNGEILTPVENLLGYQINFTKPWGDPLTIVTGLNNTGDNATTRLIENLLPATQYSFRVQSWMNGSANNVTQILNITTLPGTLDLDDFRFRGETNPFRWDWGFQTENLGNNYTSLLVSYADTINATCIFDFKFARNNQTFYNLSTVPLGSDRLLANFTMQNPDNDLIYVTCSDVDDPTNEGKTIIYQTSYPLLEQILGFRSGDYGTTGDFGVFDLITLVVVIFSMIGFNRVNSAVGAFFSLAVLGIAWTFGFINPLSATIMGFFVVGITIGVIVHHRNENNG